MTNLPMFDRAAGLRRDADLVALLAAAETVILPFWQGLQAVSETGTHAARFSAATLGDGLATLAPAAVLLGQEAGTAVVAVDLSALPGQGESGPALPGEGWLWQGLRAAAPLLLPAEAGLLAYARAVLLWRSKTRFCPQCGTVLRFEDGGHVGRCDSAACAATHFPRTDAAIIVLVCDPRGRALLGRQKSWPPGRFSCLAGFVEPGETLEQAVAREVWEEAAVRVEQPRYVASQPWPFPASLMVGFTATAPADDPRADLEELEAVRWFSRAEIRDGVTAGTLSLPPPDAIAHRLIFSWLEAE